MSMRPGKTIGRIFADETGMETLQTVMILAVACFILAIIFKVSASIQGMAFNSTDELMEFQGSPVTGNTADQILADPQPAGESTVGNESSSSTADSAGGTSNASTTNAASANASNQTSSSGGRRSGNRGGGSESYSNSMAGQKAQPVSNETVATNVHNREHDNWPIHMILACAGGILVLCLYCGRQIMKS